METYSTIRRGENAMSYQVLAVDDDPVNQKIIGLLLKHIGVTYRIAKNGKEAVEEFKKEPPSVVLMDIMMPEIDGYHASLEIRRHEFGTGRMTPIIACTALDYQFVRERCIAAAINDCITKPISRELLKVKIENWLGTSTRRQELRPDVTIDRELSNRVRWANVLDDGPIDRKYLKLVYGLGQLDEIFALFATVTEDLITDLARCVKNRDANGANNLVHEVKASSFAVGAREMAECCVQLQRCCDDQNWRGVEDNFQTLEQAFEDLQIFLQKTHDGAYNALALAP
jgi:CheY-like chemotaxis protein